MRYQRPSCKSPFQAAMECVESMDQCLLRAASYGVLEGTPKLGMRNFVRKGYRTLEDAARRLGIRNEVAQRLAQYEPDVNVPLRDMQYYIAHQGEARFNGALAGRVPLGSLMVRVS